MDADLSIDQVPKLVQSMSVLLPQEAADLAQLPSLADRYSSTAMDYHKVLVAGALLKPSPVVAPAQIDQFAKPALAAAHDLRLAATGFLTRSIERRGSFYELRQRYIYVALLVGAVLLVALMLAIAQFAARRNGDALQRAMEESARLTAELARQNAEEALRLSEAQFRAVFDGAAVGIAVLDRAGNVVDANAVFRSLFGEGIAAALEGHEQELARSARRRTRYVRVRAALEHPHGARSLDRRDGVGRQRRERLCALRDLHVSRQDGAQAQRTPDAAR